MSNAGKIDRDWLVNARSNALDDAQVSEWFVTVWNQPVELFADGSLWMPQANQWAGQDMIYAACEAIDAGV